ncbi:MAG: glycosyltransferase family 9 protein [Bacteroidia bacterium]|nr:glycosyltransferase family 9 protein [Bacteroidia bacterium]MDW8056837.1 glycosyltransferase family 9 protein [Bacteroidia bacterium]
MEKKVAGVARFLVIQPAFLGDAVLTLPLLGQLRISFPSAEIHWVLRKGVEELFQDHPWAIQLWTWDKSWREWLQLTRKLSKQKWDAVFVVQRHFRMGLLGLLVPAKTRITYDKNPLSFFYTHRVQHEFRAGIHEAARVVSLGVPVGLTAELPPLPWLFPKERVSSPTPYIILSPTSRWPTKEAPFSYWADFLRKLPSSLRIYLTGTASDRERIGSLCRYHPNAENLAGQLSLKELAALVAGAQRVYTVDSALTHIASALGVPTTTVFCSTVPAFGFGPLAPRSTIVETPEPLPCRPCGLHGKKKCPLGTFSCGKFLPPIEVETELGEIV